jgi:hypothetical protein
MSSDFNVNQISYRFYCDKLASLDQCNNLIIESSANNIELKSNNQTIAFNNNSVFNYGLTLNDRDLSNIINITGSILNVDTIFLKDIENSQANIIDSSSINYGYIRATTIGYNPTISNDIVATSNAYFTYINVSGGDSSFNDSVYIRNILGVSGPTTISNDLIVNGTSYVTLYNSIVNYISNIREELSSNTVLTLDLSATNISISNELVVHRTSFLNDISINGHLLDSVLKVPHDFTIDPSGHDNNSGTLIINGDLIVYGNKTTIASNIIEISDITLSVATNLKNVNDLYRNEAGLDISNVASIKYDGSAWNFIGGQLTVENKKVSLDVSLIALKTITEASLNNLNSYFDLSYGQLKTNNDNSFNATYTRTQMDNSFILYSNFEISYNSLINNVNNSYVNRPTYDASISSLQTYLDASYIIKGSVANPDIIDSSLIFLSRNLDLSYILKSTFEGSYNKLKEQIDISFASIRLTSLDTSSISIDTINTKHYTQRFNNILWNQIGLDISNGPPLTNNNKKVAISNDGKVVALSSSSHSDISKGRIYVYELSYNQAPYSWSQLGLSSEIIVGLSNDDQFGWDLALSSNGRVVAGSSILNDASGINSGQVRVFELSNNNRWVQLGNSINGRNIPNYQSGHSLNLSGNGKIVSISSLKGATDLSYGEVRVYELSSNNIWIQKGREISGNDLIINSSSLGTGGTRTISGDYTIHVFTTAGSTTDFIPASNGTVEVLLVGGGGAGGYSVGGGGGGGGVIYMPSVKVTAGVSYPIYVGAGVNGNNGENTTAFNAIAAGGGRGSGFGDTIRNGYNGGSGGGAGSGIFAGGDTTGNRLGMLNGIDNSGIIYGNRGGRVTTNASNPYGTYRAAGGGGAGGIASDTDTNLVGDWGPTGASSGGSGIMNNILGPNYYWGGGGGGAGHDQQFGGWGGIGGGGGGNAGYNTSYSGGIGGASALSSGITPIHWGDNGGNGGANTGGGGGGGPSGRAGGIGGSGIVVIRYLINVYNRISSTSLSLDGNTIALGSDVVSNNNKGKVSIFRFTNDWNLIGTIQGPNISNLKFGRSIKLSANGNAIVIGAPGYGTPAIDVSGYTFELNTINNTWSYHRTNASTVKDRYLAVVLNAEDTNRIRPLIGNTAAWIGGRKRLDGIGDTTSLTWYWYKRDPWLYTNWDPGQPKVGSNDAVRINVESAGWHDYPATTNGPAIYMTYITTTTTREVSNIGQAYVYTYAGGTTWTQLGQTIQGISGGDEFGSSVAISNDGSIISIGSDNNSSNRGHVRVFVNANNYWAQVSSSISGKTSTSRAGIHALSGDGTTLIQSNNTYNSVYGINKTLGLNAPMTTISGNLLVLGNITANSLDISTNHVYSNNGYSYKIFNSELNTAIMKEYYSDVTSTRHLKVQIRGDGYITNRNNSYRALSDSRLKENIVTSGPKLEDLLKVRVVDYTMKGASNTKYIGVLAQELEELFPNLVTELEPSPKDIEDGITIKYKAVNYSSFDSILIKSLQEQNAILKNIARRIEALEDE